MGVLLAQHLWRDVGQRPKLRRHKLSISISRYFSHIITHMGTQRCMFKDNYSLQHFQNMMRNVLSVQQ